MKIDSFSVGDGDFVVWEMRLRGAMVTGYCYRVLLIGTLPFVVGACQADDLVQNHDRLAVFDAAFSPISSAADDLVIVVLTNDCPYRTDSPTDVVAKRLPWCTHEIAEAFQAMLDDRGRRAGRGRLRSIRLQIQPIGLPEELTGGNPHPGPRRSVVVACDAGYRVLSFIVGVPDQQQFLGLVEDAEETQLFSNQLNSKASAERTSANPVSQLAGMLVQRNVKRVSRYYRDAMLAFYESLLETDEVGADELRAVEIGADEEDQNNSDTLFRTRDQLHRVCEVFEAVYRSDVKQRFGLPEQDDGRRLVTP